MKRVRIKRTNIHSKKMSRISSPTKIKFRKSTMSNFKRNTSNNKAIKKYRAIRVYDPVNGNDVWH